MASFYNHNRIYIFLKSSSYNSANVNTDKFQNSPSKVIHPKATWKKEFYSEQFGQKYYGQEYFGQKYYGQKYYGQEYFGHEYPLAP